MSNLKRNYIYNILYQLLIMVIPILTAPYLARTVGADGIGTYSYTYSIVYYFMLLTLLGVNNYGNRTIAKVRDDKKKLSKSFWSIYLLQLLLGVIMMAAYFGYVFLIDNQFKVIAIIQSLFILSAILDINWLFFGLEEFKKTITRNGIIKLLCVILIFVFVKNPDDVWKYALIMSGTTCLSQLVLWGFARKNIKPVKIRIKDIAEHIKPNLTLFLPVIAVSLYKMMDKIMLGSMTNMSEVGYYENAEKIINVPLAMITSLGTIMLPRMSNIIARGDSVKTKRYIEKSIMFVSFASLAMFAGLAAIGANFAPLFFGNGFEKTGYLIVLLAVTLPIISFANVLRTQYLIPREKDKIYMKSVFLGAAMNLAMNIMLIPSLDSIGACIGTIAAELAVMVYQSVAIRKEVPVRTYLIDIVPFFAKAAIMFVIVFSINFIDIGNLVKIVMQVIIGVAIYTLMNLRYILGVLNFKEKRVQR